MSILNRLKNSYSYGGVKEVLRKVFFLVIYKSHNIITKTRNNHATLEFGINRTKRQEKIVVSLTSFPARFPYLSPCLKSLIIQTLKPDMIVVYLGSDSNEDMITEEMRSFEKYGIEFRIDKTKNLMPHKKYFYAMQEYPDSVIVTADDDVIYPRDWLESLYDSYRRYPNAVSARRVHLMKRNEKGLIPYDHWEDQCRKVREPSMCLIATGNSGILYPPHCLCDDAFNVDAINKTCLRADDIWLKCMEVKNKVPVVWVKNWEVSLPDIDTNDNERLSDENVFTGTNDEVLHKVMDHFGLCSEDFFD